VFDLSAARLLELLEYLETLFDAVRLRDISRVRTLLDDARASLVPVGVRHEALLVASEPAESFRAPVELLRFHHMMRQQLESHVAAGGPAGGGAPPSRAGRVPKR
jgi:hypothetical protein